MDGYERGFEGGDGTRRKERKVHTISRSSALCEVKRVDAPKKYEGTRLRKSLGLGHWM